MPLVSSDPENITVGQVERAIARAWRLFDQYEKHDNPQDEKGSQLYRAYQRAREVAEGLEEYASWLYPTGLP